MLYRIKKDVANYLCSSKLWVGLVIGLAGYFYVFANILRSIRGSEYGINVFETYAIGSSNSWAMTVSVAGLIFALSDMPYLSTFEMNAIYRSSKQRHITEKFLYTVICTVIFFTLQFTATIFISLAFSYTDNVWSFLSSAVSSELKSNLSPASAAFVGFLLNFMYGIMLAAVLFFLSLLMDKGAAYTIIFTFQAIQDFLLARLYKFSYFCLFRNSILDYYGCIKNELIVNIVIEFSVICVSLIASVAVRNKISYDVRQGENNIL